MAAVALASLQALAVVAGRPAAASHGGVGDWVRQLGTTKGDSGYGVAVDATGNIYVTGTTYGTLPGSPDTYAGGADVFVASWDSTGASRWVRQLGTTDDDYGYGVAVDAAGNVYVTGSAGGKLPGSPDTTAGGADVFVASWDSTGASRWVRQLGTIDTDIGRGVAVDAAGNVYVTGSAGGKLPGSPDTYAGNADVFVASWDSTGASRWVRQLGTIDTDIGRGVAVDAAGNIYVTGSTDMTLPGSPDTNTGGTDVFLASWDSTGTPRRVHQLGTTSDANGAGVAVDADGNVYVTGDTYGTLPGSPDTNAGGYEVFVASWDSTGTPRWVHQLGSDSGIGVAVDASGDVYVTGSTSETLPGSPDTYAGDFDVFVASWDSTGTPRWVHQLGTASTDSGSGVAVDAGGNVYVTGNSWATLPGSPDTNSGTYDVFVARWSAPAAANTAPIADDQSVSTDVNTPLAVTLTASDDGLPDPPATLTYTITTQPTNGTLSGDAPDLTYTPNPDYSGTDTFTFTASDSELDSEPATINITISDAPPANEAPTADDQSVSTDINTPLAVTLTATDDALPDPPATLTYTIVDGPTNGTLSGDAPNLTYTPNPDYSGTDTFTFTASDSELDSEPATINITISDAPPANEAPTADDQSVSTDVNTPLAVTLTATDDALPDPPDTLTYTITTPPANGTLSGDAPNLTYTPNPDYSGTDTFNFTASDSELDSEPATITITISDAPPANEAPTADDQSVSTDVNTPLAVTLTATDDALPDPPATLTYTIVDQPTNGTLSGDAPNLTYTPNPDYSGTDTFTFTASDSELDSEPATITITIEDANNGLVETELSAMNALAWVKHGDRVVIPHAWVRLTDADTGAGIPDQEIVLTVDGQDLCTATTRTHGWAHCGGTITGDADTIAGGYDATYAGNDTYTPSQDHANLFRLHRRHHRCSGWWWWAHHTHHHNWNNWGPRH